MSASIGPARAGDLPAVLALLEENGLPPDGLEDRAAATLVAREGPGGEVVGSAALELYGRSALLRSVAVRRDRRGRGLGRRLSEEALGLARGRGAARAYLLTETAEGYFPRLGFRPTDRGEVPEDVRGSAEFVSACPEGARAMVADLVAGGAR